MEMFKSITDRLHKLTLNKADEVTAIPQQPTHNNLSRIATLSKIPATQDRFAPLPLLQFCIIAANYQKNYEANKKITDTTYGSKRIDEEPNNFYIGNEILEIANNDITDGVHTIYKKTEGLCELLTLKRPEKYTERDLPNCKEILITTDTNIKHIK